MEPQAVRESKTPAYPTRREVLAGAAGFALAGLCGRMCVFAATEEGKTIVAPIFEHGEGRGATGCVVLSPPVFLSEEEAMQIIREELAKHGVQLKDGIILKGVRIPERMARTKENGKTRLEEIDPENDPEFRTLPKEAREEARKHAPRLLGLSGIDASKKVATKFVSEARYTVLGGALDGMSWEYDFKEVARYVAGKAKEQGKDAIYLGVFYDPMVAMDMEAMHKRREKIGFGAAWEEANKERRDKARKLLRQQVRDFAAWLKEKKVVQ
jgi:hypothetical protein